MRPRSCRSIPTSRSRSCRGSRSRSDLTRSSRPGCFRSLRSPRPTASPEARRRRSPQQRLRSPKSGRRPKSRRVVPVITALRERPRARVGVARAQELAGRGFGDAAIRFSLEGEGLTAEIVDDALASLDPEPERVQGLLDARGRTLKTLRWLAAKGFDAAALEDLGGFA